ncbi:hypothetical protein W97_04373 [Coniosporium apollinis CBS 100218]|uniref:Protein-tyrosine phosphatase n=1 Tax=Coniosporium apollinis (strain CBS 100218) TaxID=1168221 RepID=R7YU09_CONA1|nr:uncharacterized protein W97_04373 [Coniosporium apollinis CBS 100218]EON65136.1 hypothetical protein W97_04373 [Coniosporium apollinis CBS 100218]
MSSPLSVPVSMLSSKRSRSRDSAKSSAGLSAASTMSLDPSDTESPRKQQEMDTEGEQPPLPAFLRQTRSGSKFVNLEWQQRNRLALGANLDADPPSQWARVAGDDVIKRNRYMNVDPYLSNRIKLKVPEGHSDYINASPIFLRQTRSGTEKNFIATQGPKEGLHGHIYRMLWHETSSPAVIVMLTQTHEAGKEKCFQYFPHSLDAPTLNINENDEFEDGFICTVTLVNITEDAATRSTIRELEVKLTTGETKTIWHLLFAGWPDFLVPEGEERTALLHLIDLSSAKNALGSPRVVHCSAGVGRSGTFIALDWLLAELSEGSLDEVPDEDDPIADVVDKLRMQRMMMVQGEAQFWFLYDVVKDLWVERWRQKNDLSAPAPVDSRAGEGEASGSGGERERGTKFAKLEALEAEMRMNVERL